MTAIAPPPLQESIARTLAGGKQEVTFPWAAFFNGVYEGDAGQKWDPVFTNLTESGGAADITGVYGQINQNMVLFNILIEPAGSVSATAGSTYASGFPLQFTHDTFCIAVTGGLGGLPGHVVSSTNRIYIPALSSVTVPVSIIGVGFAR